MHVPDVCHIPGTSAWAWFPIHAVGRVRVVQAERRLDEIGDRPWRGWAVVRFSHTGIVEFLLTGTYLHLQGTDEIVRARQGFLSKNGAYVIGR